jgi:shikimate kinase|tara:strand:- start:1752 stop:2267 length:516 start_codon:yes stop_codon:yes gene_type:complete
LKKNLVLTGMMGVGKSTVGKNLAQKLSYNFVDIDRTIESREGSTINLIFKNKSESYFRKLENEISLEKLKKKNTVISLGGGAFLNKSIRREIKNTSVSFWLDVDVSELIKRLKKTKKRPLLYNKNLNVTVNKIYLERKKTYSEADFRIKCNFLGPDKIVDKILKLYEKSGN